MNRQYTIIEVSPPVSEEMVALIAQEGAEFMRRCNAGAAHKAPDKHKALQMVREGMKTGQVKFYRYSHSKIFKFVKQAENYGNFF